MLHQFIINKFSLEPDGKTKIWVKIDLEEITFLTERRVFGYSAPGALGVHWVIVWDKILRSRFNLPQFLL